MSRSVVAAAVLALSGCAVGPVYQPPAPVALERFANGQLGSLAHAQTSHDQLFWQGFDDLLLLQLLEQTLEQNQDLIAAAARYQAAAALLRGARRDRWPSVTSRSWGDGAAPGRA